MPPARVVRSLQTFRTNRSTGRRRMAVTWSPRCNIFRRARGTRRHSSMEKAKLQAAVVERASMLRSPRGRRGRECQTTMQVMSRTSAFQARSMTVISRACDGGGVALPTASIMFRHVDRVAFDGRSGRDSEPEDGWRTGQPEPAALPNRGEQS